eukprot:scaffold38291_cov58-Phaeocystis_antarctica.AAC.2
MQGLLQRCTSHAHAPWRLHCPLHSGGILGAATRVPLDRASCFEADIRGGGGSLARRVTPMPSDGRPARGATTRPRRQTLVEHRILCVCACASGGLSSFETLALVQRRECVSPSHP